MFRMFWITACVILGVLPTSSSMAQDQPPLPDDAPAAKRDFDADQNPIQEPLQFQMAPKSGSRRTFSYLSEQPGLLVDTINIFQLLRYEPVRQELGIEGSQVSDLWKVQFEAGQSRRDALRRLTASENAQNMSPQFQADLEAEIEKHSSNKRDRLETVLLPFQVERLEEIALELQIQSRGIVAVLNDPKMVNELAIEAEQLEELRSRAVENVRKLDQQILELKRAIREDLVSVLDRSQQEKLKSMLGDKFDWHTTAPESSAALEYSDGN